MKFPKMKFRIKGSGHAIGNQREWLDPKVKNLPYLFSLDEAEHFASKVFSKSVMKRMGSAKDGTKITLRKGRSYHIWIECFDKKLRAQKKKNDTTEIRVLGKKVKALVKNKDVKELLTVMTRIMKLSKNVKIVPDDIRELCSNFHWWYENNWLKK
jgi:CHAD domain-containing protein